jgi:hypothetical protein
LSWRQIVSAVGASLLLATAATAASVATVGVKVAVAVVVLVIRVGLFSVRVLVACTSVQPLIGAALSCCKQESCRVVKVNYLHNCTVTDACH